MKYSKAEVWWEKFSKAWQKRAQASPQRPSTETFLRDLKVSASPDFVSYITAGVILQKAWEKSLFLSHLLFGVSLTNGVR